MVSGDRQVVVGEKGPFWSMQREFSRHFGQVDELCPKSTEWPARGSAHGNG
jgi:hypothetical protein